MIALLLRHWGLLALLIAAFSIPFAVAASFKAGQEARARRVAEGQVSTLDKMINEPVVGFRDRLSACTVDLGNATASLNRQNAAVEAMRAEADARGARTRQAVSAAQDRARTAERRVQSLLQTTPRDGETPCVAAERLIREEIR